MKRSDFIKKTGAAAFTASWAAAGKKEIIKQDLLRPKKLKPGDTVGLVAPAGIIYDLEEYVLMRRVLADFGLETVFGDHVYKRHGYLAGTDRERANDLNAMFVDREINGIMAVRGGWGCARIIPFLDFKSIARNPKVYCGFSDNTTLHHALLAHCGIISFHGPNGNSDWSELTKNSFRSVVMDGSASEYTSDSNVEILQQGVAHGRLIGGNLSILTTTLGTSFQPDANGAILFLEEVGEDTYRIDRMFAHLKQAGILDQISGFIFGKCTDCSAGNPPTFEVKEVLEHYILPLKIPAIINADIGHEQDNFTLPMGVQAELNADEGSFRLLEPAVV